MKQKDRVELERDMLAKLVRSHVRTKYAILGDRELNERLPIALKKFDLQVQKGRLPSATKMALEAV